MCAADSVWANKNLAKFDEFNQFVLEWVNLGNIQKIHHFRLQTDYICGKENDGRALLDFIGYYEQIERDFSFINCRIGAQALLRGINVNQNRDRAVEIVAKVYERDINFLGYDFDNVVPKRLSFL